MAGVTVRPPNDEDFPQLAAMDLRYAAGRVLALDRSGEPPEHAFTLRWRRRDAPEALYAEYTAERLPAAVEKVDRFAVAECDGRAVGLAMIMVPSWTDAGEITDLAVDRAYRRRGAGRALVDDAVAYARSRRLRSLWVEPRSDNAGAVEFYLRLGFRLSGFNDRMYSNADDADGRLTLFMQLEL
jgi:ribosomal protein S18 acetylase RimI-like enzyme